MTDGRSVAITGLGSVSAAGCGWQAASEAFAASRVILTEVDRSAGYHRPGAARQAVLVSDVDLSPWLRPMAARRMSRASRYATAAARMAVSEAGLAAPDLEQATVAVGTAYGAVDVTEKILRQIMLEGPEAVSPALFTESVANAPAAHVALELGARGPNLTVAQRQASPLLALQQGAAAIRAGRADVVIVGAVDEMNPLLHAILDRFGALARPVGDGDEVARPFDAHRDGCLAGEGAAVAVLEPEDVARRRGARVIARVKLGGAAFDPTAPRTGWGNDPRHFTRAMSRIPHLAGDRLSEIGGIVSGGCGLWAGDRLEGRVLRSLFGGGPVPPVLAPKAVVGEHGGGFLAAAVLAAAGAAFGPTPGFAQLDTGIGITPHSGGRFEPSRAVLATSFAAGGAAAWSVLGPGDP